MPPITSTPITLPEDVRKFCAAHDLFSDLDLAVHIAEETFGRDRDRQFSLEVDAETDEEWIAVDVYLSISPDEAVRLNSLFVQRWAASGRPEALSAIRVIPNLA